MTSPVIPEERSIEGSLPEEGTFIPERTDCKSISWIGTFPDDAPVAVSEDADAFGREEGVVGSSAVVAGTGAATVGEFSLLSRVVVEEELLLDLLPKKLEFANSLLATPPNNCSSCCWLMFPSKD